MFCYFDFESINSPQDAAAAAACVTKDCNKKSKNQKPLMRWSIFFVSQISPTNQKIYTHKSEQESWNLVDGPFLCTLALVQVTTAMVGRGQVGPYVAAVRSSSFSFSSSSSFSYSAAVQPWPSPAQLSAPRSQFLQEAAELQSDQSSLCLPVCV